MNYEVPVGQTNLQIPFYLFHKNTGSVLTSPSGIRVFKVTADSAPQELAGVSSVDADGRVIVNLDDTHFSSYSNFAVFVISDYGRSHVARVVVGEKLAAYVNRWVLFPVFKQDGSEDIGVTAADVQVEILTSYDSSAIKDTLTVSPSEFYQLSVTPSLQLPYYNVLIPGSYFVPDSVTSLALVHPHGRSTAQFQVSSTIASIDVVTSPSLIGVSVEFLDSSDHSVVASAVTSAFGQIKGLELPKGDYLVRLHKSGLTFTKNNVPISIDSDYQSVILDTTYTVDAVTPAEFCKIYFRFVKADGSPFSNMLVKFIPKSLLNAGTAGTVRTRIEVRTDHNGYGEVHLIPGLNVVVHLEGTRLHEEFTVPNATEANLLDLISFKDNSFETYVADFDDAIRRTL